MGVVIKKVETRKDMRVFTTLPWKIYRDDPVWAPELIMDLKKRLNPKRHPFFETGEIQYFLAYKDGEAVGGIAAIDSFEHNRHWNEKTGFFGFFECVNDQETANALFDAVKEWHRDRGMNRIRGPMNCSTNDICGMQIESDGSHQMVVMPYNPKYYPGLCVNYGFKKAKDLICFKLDLTQEINPKVLSIADSIRKRAESKGLTIRHMNRKKFDIDMRMMYEIYKEAWSKNWGFVPLTPAEYNNMASAMNLISDPRLTVMIEKNGEPVGFAAAVFDLMEITHSLRRLQDKPLWYQSLRQLLRVARWMYFSKKLMFKRGRLILAGVKSGFRQLGFDSLLYTIPFESAKKMGLTFAELSWELEDNVAIISGIEKMGGKIYKVNRIWDYDISNA